MGYVKWDLLEGFVRGDTLDWICQRDKLDGFVRGDTLDGI